MAYVKNIWVDQEVERPRTYQKIDNADGSFTLVDDFGLVSELGTPVNADNMNHIEEGIEAGSFTKYDGSATYFENDLVTSFLDEDLVIYKSLKDNNIGNPLTDANYWKEIKLGGGGGFNLFDTKLVDHILEGDEAKGWELQGTFVYKEALAGSRNGYPDFYERVINEFNNTSSVDMTTKWVQPVATADITTITGGDMEITASSVYNTTYPAYKVMDGDAESGGWASKGSTTAGWWQVKFPYQIKVKGLTFVSSHNATYSAKDCQFFTSADMTTPIGNAFLGSASTFTATKVLGIPAEGVITDTIYLNITSSNSTAIGMGELIIEAEKYEFSFLRNANGHQFYDIADKSVIDDWFEKYGVADFYGVDTANKRVLLPRNKYFMQLTGDTSLVNDMNFAGLPNAQGKSKIFPDNDDNFENNAFTTMNSTADTAVFGATDNRGSSSASLAMDLSLANPIYGNSDTVQPPSSNKLLYYCVGNTEVQGATTEVVDVTTTENDTIPLFTGLFFEFKPNNVSWLKGGEQVNSGGIYEFTYNELANELTNPKYNLKIVEESNMIAGIDYSEYWKINQDEMYFITPTKISYLPISGDTASVIGNGMTIGLNGGDTLVESGLAFTGANATGLTARYSQLQQPAGVKLTDATQWVGSAGNSGHYGVGLSTDPNKSGIIADLTSAKSETAQLYFKVANAVQNIEAINVGEVLEALADKISRQDCPAYIVESYVNGTSWFDIYSNGKCRQGGYIPKGDAEEMLVTFLKPYANNNYSLTGGVVSSSTSGDGIIRVWGAGWNLTPTGFTTYRPNTAYDGKFWVAEGYIA